MKGIFGLCSLLFLYTCSGHESGSNLKRNFQNFSPENSLVHHARGFQLFDSNRVIHIIVFNPWNKRDTLASYLLIPDSMNLSKPDSIDYLLKYPVTRVVSLTSSCIGMYAFLDKRDYLLASGDANLICDSLLYTSFLNRQLVDLGENIHLNTEIILAQNPDLVVKYIYGSRDETDNALANSGIPVAYLMEYMENSPLARAEWIKFVAAFTGQLDLADSLFRQIEINYLELRKLAETAKEKPTILDGSSYKGIWYVAGGQSYPAKLYADAGSDYFWKNDSTAGSLSLSFESVLDSQVNADFWFGPSSSNKLELLGIESRYGLFKSFKNGNVYHFGKRTNPNGGLDYYESGVVHPDVLLKDLIKILHPTLVEKEYQTVYLEKISN